MPSKDYYSILGVPRNADDKTIKKKYRTEAVKWHPDKWVNGTEEEKRTAEQKFKDISEAYNVLSDKEKRANYDRFGTPDVQPNMGYGMDDDGFMSPFMRGFGNMHRGPVKPAPMKMRMKLTLDELYNGIEKKIRYHRLKPCSHCNGSGLGPNGHKETCSGCGGTGFKTTVQRSAFGTIQQQWTCDECNGTGEKIVGGICHHCHGEGVERMEEILTVPTNQGIFPDAAIVMQGYGNYNKEGYAGDIMILFEVDMSNEDFFFVKDDNYNIYTNVHVGVLDAITGTDIIIEGVNGDDINVHIPMGAKDKTVLSVSNKGLINGSGGRGDMKCVISLDFPTSLNKESIETINKLKENKDFKTE